MRTTDLCNPAPIRPSPYNTAGQECKLRSEGA